MSDHARLLNHRSFTELGARERTRALLDPGSFRELLDPFERLISPWLPAQGIVAQADDGVVIAKGTLDGQPAVIAAIEGAFQGGSMGEVGGAKIAGALELAAQDNRNGVATRACLLLETGGVRLQEANLGLAAIAEIQAAIVDLRRYQAVVGIIAGPVGCFGGMSIAAGLCSHLIVTREARLGLNGPQVIEQEAGIDEFDSRDRPFIWSLTGGEQRCASGLADAYIADDLALVRNEVIRCVNSGPAQRPRSSRHTWFLQRIASLGENCPALSAEDVRTLYEEKHP
jgi:malonate decarboxylase beta subunit